MKQAIVAAAAAVALVASTAIAHAQQGAAAASVNVQSGATVYGSDGSAIGTVVATQGDAVLIDTGDHEISLPANAFGSGEKGPTLNMTKAALVAEHEKTLAERAAKLKEALVVGAEIKTADAQPLGSVQAIDGDNVVIDAASGPLTMTRDYFSVDPTGAVIVLTTMAQIREAVAAAAQED